MPGSSCRFSVDQRMCRRSRTSCWTTSLILEGWLVMVIRQSSRNTRAVTRGRKRASGMFGPIENSKLTRGNWYAES